MTPKPTIEDPWPRLETDSSAPLAGVGLGSRMRLRFYAPVSIAAIASSFWCDKSRLIVCAA
jgi:hypothetical protein